MSRRRGRHEGTDSDGGADHGKVRGIRKPDSFMDADKLSTANERLLMRPFLRAIMDQECCHSLGRMVLF